MYDGPLIYANFIALVFLLLWPRERRSAELVCPEQAIVERVPAAVEKSLDFALASLENCKHGPTSEQQCSYYSLFWFGFLCGSLAVLVLVFFTRFLYNLLVAPGRQQPGPQQAAPAPQALAPAQVVEPANPNTLRQLGLLR